jgi:putative NADH-flavin reductase
MDMRLFVLGASGRTGLEVLELARLRGHEVTAFVRSPAKLDHIRRQRSSIGWLDIVQGDARETDALAAALPGHDAVLSAIGPPPLDALLRRSTLLSETARATVGAMTAAGVDRVAILSAAVLFPERGLTFAFVRWILKYHARDLAAMEHVVRTSDLQWTIARPPRLTASTGIGFRAQPGGLPHGAWSMSYRALATFMLETIEQGAHIGEVVGLAALTARGVAEPDRPGQGGTTQALERMS